MNEKIIDVGLIDGLRAEGTDGKHIIVFDEPVEDGGTDLGPTPVQTLLGALGACSVITMRLYAERKGWNFEDAKVTVRLFPGKGKEPAKVVQEIELRGDLDDDQRERLRTIAGRCPVHRIMEGPTEFEEVLVG